MRQRQLLLVFFTAKRKIMQTHKLLVADDDEMIRTVAAIQLGRLGFLCESAQDGAEALEYATANEYGLILMDVQMPNMDGLEATQAIRNFEKAHARSHVPIVALTANPDENQCMDAGMDDFLFKPVFLDDLRRVLNRWLNDPQEGNLSGKKSEASSDRE
jgi:CheY-like chemotaxis protein